VRKREQTLFIVILALVCDSVALAQSAQMYIYPSKGQSQQQQDKDRYECHSWAVQQTGFDPSKTNPGNSQYLDPQPYLPSQRHVIKGAGRGAALGAIGGAIAGDAGKGAAAGAAVGGGVGVLRRRDERRQQASDSQQQRAQAQTNQVGAYQRAMAACLQGRGYNVN
jgi:hypothetical protein